MNRLLVTVAVLAAALATALVIGLRERSAVEREIAGPGADDASPASDDPLSEDAAPLLEAEGNAMEEEPPREELSGSSGAQGTGVLPPRPDSAVARGRLVDAATGEPLPDYVMRLHDAAGRREEVVTDAEGRFATPSPLANGDLRIRFLDSRSSPRSLPAIVREHAVSGGCAPEIDLAVASGPTYRFSLTPEDAVPATELLARLRLASRDAQVVLDPEPLRPPAGDDSPWVRFAPVPEKFDRAVAIDLESKDGLWVGTAQVSAVRGVVSGVVPIRLEARGVLRGVVVGADGELVEGAQVRFLWTTAAGKQRRAGARTESDGAFRFPALEEAAGRLSVRSLRHAPEDLEVRIAPGMFTTQNVLLRPLPPVGAIQGRLESQTGTYASSVDVELRVIESAAFTDFPPPPASVRVAWETVEARRVGAFDFPGLPAGKYEVTVRDDGWFAWEPKSVSLSPPASGFRFLVRDDLAHAEFAFRVRDSDGGGRLENFHASIQAAGGQPRWKRCRSEVPVLSRFPLERRFKWRVDREGFEPAIGDERAFSIEESREGRVWRFAEVDLRRGWGEVFRVVSRAKGKPIAGALVRLDGRDAGTTGADGTAKVFAPERPRTVEVVYRDWVPAESIDFRPVAWRREKRYVLVKLAVPASR